MGVGKIRIGLIVLWTLGQSLAQAATSTSTELHFGYSSYLRSNQPYYGSEYKSASLATAGISLTMQNPKGESKSKMDFDAFQSFNEDESYYNLRELYFDFGQNGADLSLGRRKYAWSEADLVWDTGFWQPQFKWDGLRTEQQGLIGGFWSENISKKNKVTAAVLPLFVPDTTPNFRESNGRFLSENPWFRAAPPRTTLFEEPTDIYSHLEKPKTDEVLFNPGLAIRWDHQRTEHETVGVAYAYKPVNQIFNAFNYKLRAAQEDGGVNLTFYPWVGYHHLFTTDWKFEDRRFGHLASFTYEAPTRLLDDESMVYQQLKDSYVLSWLSFYNVKGEGPSAFKIYGGYQRHFGGFAPDGGEVIQEGTQFDIRPRYLSTFKLGAKYPIWNRVRRLQNGIEVNYDTIMNGGTVLSEVEYAFENAWVVSLNMDLIGVLSEVNPVYKNNFINSYRANDRVQLRFNYVY